MCNKDEEMKQFYVYVYRDPSRKNEPIYCGKGQDDRAYVHLSRIDKHPFTHRLQFMKANGIEPIINVVNLPSEALAFQCEIDSIARFGRKDLKLGPLLNQTDGGEGASGWIENAETRRKKADAHKGKKSSQYRIPKPRVTCPHCGKEGGKPSMMRHHFDKCKFNTSRHPENDYN